MAGDAIVSPGTSNLTYVDRLEVTDTFVDGLRRIAFDGVNLRLEFVVNRYDDAKKTSGPTGSAVTACRLVIPMPGMLELSARLHRLIDALKQQGVLKPTSSAHAPQS